MGRGETASWRRVSWTRDWRRRRRSGRRGA